MDFAETDACSFFNGESGVLAPLQNQKRSSSDKDKFVRKNKYAKNGNWLLLTIKHRTRCQKHQKIYKVT